MKLPPFELHAPSSVEEATELLERFGEEAAVYSGGTELLLLMKLGFAEPRHLVDVKGISELRGLAAHDGILAIGGATTHCDIERSSVVRERWPALASMERSVANVRVRGAGSLGGNLCFSDPHSDPATFLLAAGGEIVLRRGRDGRRSLPVGEFVRGPYATALEPGELLTEVRVPEAPAGSALAHKKLAFHERPAVTVSCLARVSDGRVVDARVAVGSVGLVPARSAAAESLLLGTPGDAEIEAAGEAAAATAEPVADLNGSVEYKRHLVRVLVGRTFREALGAAA